ncbi:MAG: hypothetical protein M3417_03330 [Actinomycetota bacterium]|nr:hypothetical protein [Actinomycetota bacterium]
MTFSSRLRALLPAALLILLLGADAAAPAAAVAARAPAVTTGSAVGVTQSSATVRGTVNPNDVQTRFAFEYGPTRAYGAATPPVAIGKGTSTRSVSAAVAGLAPATTYHYRIVATSGAGTSRGADRTFKTSKQPLGLSLAATPNPVPFGGSTSVVGTLSGTDNANRQIVLQHNAFPFTAGFAPVGNPQVTNATGTFAFPILSLTRTTQFRVQVPGRSVPSPIVTALVAVTVRTAVSSTRVRRGRSVRFAGSITPIRDGAQVAVQKQRDGRWITIGGTVARHYRDDRSKYAVRVKISRGGSYRVFVGTNSGDIANNVGRTVKIRSFR